MNTGSIETVFAEAFEHWDIRLPEANVEACRQGRIRQRGWRIDYLFGEQNGQVYVEYYASHRMAGDRHVRIYSSQESRRSYQAMLEAFLYKEDNPGDRERAEREYFEHNRQVAEYLRTNGLRVN